MKDDAVSRQAAIDAVNAHYDDEYFNFYTVMDILKQLPSAQRKGKWYAIGNTGLATCECGYITDRHSVYNYCPKCGALMKGEDDE